MYTRIFALISAVVIPATLAVKGFAALDYEHFSIPTEEPLKLINKVFTTDGFDPAASIRNEIDTETKRFEDGKDAMNKEFVEIMHRIHRDGPRTLSDLKNFAPHVKKLDIGSL